jgi:hypothetical protein
VPLLQRQWSWPGAGRWRRHPWRSCSDAQGAMARPGRRQCHGMDKLPAVYTSGRQLSGRWARTILTGWAGTVDMCWVQSGAQPFSNYSNFAPILKYKTKTILMSINVQTWHAARVEYSKQLLPLGPLPIPNRIPVIKFGTNTTLNISLNF